MRALLPVVGVAVLALLAGCSAPPPRVDVSERFQIELEAATDGLLEPGDPELVELADSLADDALEGMCGEPGYWAGLAEQRELTYAWAVTCDMYFSEDMSDAQRERVRDILIEQVTADLTE